MQQRANNDYLAGLLQKVLEIHNKFSVPQEATPDVVKLLELEKQPLQ